jgi:hypothetical protein
MATTRTSRRKETFGFHTEETVEGRITEIRLTGGVDVAARDGWLCFWTAGREVRIGPLTADQAEKLSEDLGYEALG